MPALLEQLDLPGTERKRCEDLSKGMLQRVQFIAAMMHQPDLLILDEPFSGHDPVSVRLLREHIGASTRAVPRCCCRRTSWPMPKRCASTWS